MLRRVARPFLQNYRMAAPMSRISKRFCYYEDYDPYFFILSMYDNEPRDGLLQYHEFEHMVSVFSISEAHVQRLQEEFFPTKQEELPPHIFGELWEKLFDENGDGVMQMDEFTKMMSGFDVSEEVVQAKQEKFFPTGDEELSEEQLKELYKGVEKAVGGETTGEEVKEQTA